jgi:hypothetical protein
VAVANRSFAVVFIVIGAVVLAAASLWYALTPSRPVQPVEVAPPPPPELSGDLTRRLMGERVRVVADTDTRPPLSPDGYAFVVAGAEAGADPSGLFRDLFAGYPLPVAAGVLSASVALDDGRRLPPVPVAVLGPSPDFKTAFVPGPDGLRATPLFASNGARKATISFSLAYVEKGDPALLGGLVGEAESLYGFLTSEPAPLWTSPGGVQLRAQAFSDRLAAMGAKKVDDAFAFDILLADAADSRGRALEAVDPTGKAVARFFFRIGAHGPFFTAGTVSSLSLAALFVQPADSGRTVGGYLASRAGAALAQVLTADAAGFAEACGELRRRLTGSTGFGGQDNAVILRAVDRVRALYADPKVAACSTPDDLALTEKAGFPASSAKPVPMNAGRDRRMDAVVKQMASALHPSVPPALRESLASRFAPGVALFDATRFWLALTSGQVVENGDVAIVPATNPTEAMNLLATLPVARLGCAAGPAEKGAARRLALVELEHDSALWALDLAFDDSDRVAGISLAEATQADYCRAVKSGRPGIACPFAKAGKTYRGIAPGKC